MDYNLISFPIHSLNNEFLKFSHIQTMQQTKAETIFEFHVAECEEEMEMAAV